MVLEAGPTAGGLRYRSDAVLTPAGRDQLVNGLACGRAGNLWKKGRTMVSII